MQLNLLDMLSAFSYCLDAIEQSVAGRSDEHGLRVAFLTERMAKAAGISGDALLTLTGCAILHDNALYQYMSARKAVEEGKEDKHSSSIRDHCILGEEQLKYIPFPSDSSTIILYHHERADGKGPFGKKEGEFRLGSALIHLADNLDIHFPLQNMTGETYQKVSDYVDKNKGTEFCRQAADLFHKALSIDTFHKADRMGLKSSIFQDVPCTMTDFSEAEIRGLAGFMTRIIDYKSSFTSDHSKGVAEKAERMARFYGWPEEKVLRFFFAGALHDIGKIFISHDILEKPGKLESKEFDQMKNHAAGTLHVLSQIRGLEDITEWASNHHEKLDGQGYPRGLTADQLTFEDRLMACVDIYQALSEKRPYKEGLPHNEVIKIMRNMASMNKIDGRIVEDMDKALA
ncbi:MAG: HD domain-containing protein [Lachnospiraceae bacterium]|nr:HD domain-containing protein [Lachnospiraceae bacterium]